MKSLLNHLSSIYIYLPLSLLYTQRGRQETATLNSLTHRCTFPRRNQDMEIVKLVKTHPSPNTPAII